MGFNSGFKWLTKCGFIRQTFAQVPGVRLHQSPSGRSREDITGQTDGHIWRSYYTLSGALREHAKNERRIASRCKWKLAFI